MTLVRKVVQIFKDSHGIYGSRKIKRVLRNKHHLKISRRKIRTIMIQEGLVSVYTHTKYKAQASLVNEENTPNLLKRKFNDLAPYSAVVSDLTYVKVDNEWLYICIMLDLFNREIIGHSVGKHHDSKLVCAAFDTILIPFRKIGIFHTDRGGEFKSSAIDSLLKSNGIKRSLSMKGCPYDNAVAESTFKIIKTEFIHNQSFKNLKDLKEKLDVYVYWYNYVRIHGALEYQTPVMYRINHNRYPL